MHHSVHAARELRPALELDPVVSEAPLLGNSNAADAADTMLRRVVERRVVMVALAIAVYMILVVFTEVIIGVTTFASIAERVQQQLDLQANPQAAAVTGALPAFIVFYGVLLVSVASVVAFLFALCGCCGAKGNMPSCTRCFCCCSAWHSCLTCAGLLQALTLFVYFHSEVSPWFQHFGECDPAMCHFNGSQSLPMGANNSSSHLPSYLRQVDCLAQAQWGSAYLALNGSDKRLSHEACGNFPLLSCKGELDCSDSYYDWQQHYKMSLAGASCPCGTTHILDPGECRRAMRHLPKTRIEPIMPFSDDFEPSGCYAQQEGEWAFNFNENMCNPKAQHKHVVCIVADESMRRATQAKMEKTCGRSDGGSQQEDGHPHERNPFELPNQPVYPLKSCRAHRLFSDIFQLAKAEAPGAFATLRLLSTLGVVFDGLGIALFSLGCWWGLALLSTMQATLPSAVPRTHGQVGLLQASLQPSARQTIQSQELRQLP